jgi:hypothetical protein
MLARARCSISIIAALVAALVAVSACGDGVPSYHSFDDPRLYKLGGLHLIFKSADDADQYEDYAGDVREEVTLPPAGDVTPPEPAATPVADGYWPSIACGDECVIAWSKPSDHTVRAVVHASGGWSTPLAFEDAIHGPATAAYGDTSFVTWATWLQDSARVELRRIGASGAVTGSWTLTTIATQGHLGVAASATGGVVTWERIEVAADGEATSAWLDAQLLDASGVPDGAPLELAVPSADAEYYLGAPAVFAGGVYHVALGGLGAGVPWVVVDPAARTIALDPLAGLPGAIDEIVPLADGYALLAGDVLQPSIVRVTGGAVAQTVAITGPASIAPLPDGGLAAAYASDGSIYATSVPPTFDALAAPQEIAARYEVHDF